MTRSRDSRYASPYSPMARETSRATIQARRPRRLPMFVQVIEGQTNDAGALRSQFGKWDREVKAGATGFLGSTAGVSEDGTFVAMARFESEEAARTNSD